MIKELYTYSCPKIFPEQNNFSSPSAFILGASMFSLLAAIFINITVGIVITAIYVVLTLLTFINKDIKLRYLEQASLCVLDISIISIYMVSKLFPEQQTSFWSLILGGLFSVIYEIVIIIKIKNRLYSNPGNTKKFPVIISSSTLFIVTLVFKLINRNQSTHRLAVLALILLCAAVILVVVISVQKLFIYLLTRGKIQ